MTASQRFCLRWNNHQSNLLTVFDQLLQDEAFVDVTLAVEGMFLKAHKMVLSACSPYFQTLFVNNPDKHPIVILKDVPYVDMKSLLDFMYRGEVSVNQERLTAFLKVAESLRIKGLTEVNEEKCDLPSITSNLLSSVSCNSDTPSVKRAAPALHQINVAAKRKKARPRRLSGNEADEGTAGASSVASSVSPSDAAGGASGLSNRDSEGDIRTNVQNPSDLCEMSTDYRSPSNDKEAGGNSEGSSPEQKNAQESGAKEIKLDKRVKDEPEPTPGPSNQDPIQSYGSGTDTQESETYATDGTVRSTIELHPSFKSFSKKPLSETKTEQLEQQTSAGYHFLTHSEVTCTPYEQPEGVAGHYSPSEAFFHYGQTAISSDSQQLSEASDGVLIKTEIDDDTSESSLVSAAPELSKQELWEYVIKEDGSVICKWCGEVLPSRTHWYRHKYKVHAVNLFKCEKCNIFFKTRKGYAGHIDNRHSDPEKSGCDSEVSIRDESLRTEDSVSHIKESPRAERKRMREIRSSDWEEQRRKEEQLVAEIIDRVRKECEAQGTTMTRQDQPTSKSKMKQYIAEPTIPHDQDPLLYWKFKSEYPNLKQVVRKYLGIPAASVFSVAEQICDKRGARARYGKRLNQQV